jgi:hypothetical protein
MTSNNKVPELIPLKKYGLAYKPNVASFCSPCYDHQGTVNRELNLIQFICSSPMCKMFSFVVMEQQVSRFLSDLREQLQKHMKRIKLFMEMKLYLTHLSEWFKRLRKGCEDPQR